jgi:hypothetical protein
MTHRKLFAIAALVAALAVPSTASAQTIQPGVPIESDGSGCTLAWIFNGGDTYAATAAHCVSGVGAPVNLATNLHTPIERIGQVAFMGNAEEPGRDYAFIRIDPDDVGDVSPALKGHPNIPTGVSRNYANGNLIQFSGFGLGFNFTAPTQERRIGVLNATDGVEHDVLGPVTPGDSGGPVGNVSDGNTAFGIVNTLGVGVNTGALTVVTAGEGGTNLDFVLRDAASRGFNVTLRTVGG